MDRLMYHKDAENQCLPRVRIAASRLRKTAPYLTRAASKSGNSFSLIPQVSRIPAADLFNQHGGPHTVSYLRNRPSRNGCSTMTPAINDNSIVNKLMMSSAVTMPNSVPTAVTTGILRIL